LLVELHDFSIKTQNMYEIVGFREEKKLHIGSIENITKCPLDHEQLL